MLYLILNSCCTSLLPASTLEVRLVGGDGKSSGRLEVNYNGKSWGTVCDDRWGFADADVACRMLNYKSASAFYTNAVLFGPGMC